MIELELTPIEQVMLQNIPTEQLTVIINQTEVPQQQRRAFLGTAAAAMLAVLTGIATGCPGESKGSRPNDPQPVGGARSDLPGDRYILTGGEAPDMPEPGMPEDYAHPKIPPGAVSAGIPPDLPDKKTTD